MIKSIFVTLLVIFFIRLVAPVLLRWLLAAFIKKKVRNGSFFYTNMHQQPRQYQQQQENGHSKQAEGKVKIDYVPEQQGRKGFDGGEYVDYEEVK